MRHNLAFASTAMEILLAGQPPQPAIRSFDAQPGEWPEPLAIEAFHGIAGEFVRAIEPHSEADPAALLVQFLVMFGNLVGRNAHFRAEADLHHTNLFCCLVGQTAKGRKGTSLGRLQEICAAVDRVWVETRMVDGLASGEGLIAIMKDADSDRRLMVTEGELARVLQVCEREGSTLSPILRNAWDHGNLRVLTKKDPITARGAHVSVIGHITVTEVQKLLSHNAANNGFANRFLWVAVRRSKVLPEGGAFDIADCGNMLNRLQDAVQFGRSAGELRRNANAAQMWRNAYTELSEGKPGLLGAVTSRAEAQTMRVATIFALLDQSECIQPEHLAAALAVWEYCENSARVIFGDAVGNPVADGILAELRESPEGMTRTEARNVFGRNRSSMEVGRALEELARYGLVQVKHEPQPKGRPVERWFATEVRL